ncbi:putative colanic acid biosynthesis acetyltransferase [Rhodopirellula sp. SM50]|nr:putative colanic acid biosynthesis acetyltransferase [Rhodopirellula sp. SM50]PAY17882.1 putative colanic acid biosynthesis acetyltransferase [Rhodopirellula sp. SM50]
MSTSALLDASTTNPSEGGASYSLSNRLLRVLWKFAWITLAAWTPAPLHRYRVAILRLFGADVDWNAHVYSNVKIWLPSHLTMESHACLGPGVNCYCMAPISLGRGAIVSQGTTLCAATHDIRDPDFQLVAKPISVGAGAWVAAEAFVGPGVKIGDRAVVGARAVLCRDAEEEGVYVGNPATLIKKRGGSNCK